MIHWLISPLPDLLIDPLALSPPLLFHLSPTMISLKTGTIKKLSIMEKFEKRAVSYPWGQHITDNVLMKKTGPNIGSSVGRLTICLIKQQKNNHLLWYSIAGAPWTTASRKVNGILWQSQYCISEHLADQRGAVNILHTVWHYLGYDKTHTRKDQD